MLVKRDVPICVYVPADDVLLNSLYPIVCPATPVEAPHEIFRVFCVGFETARPDGRDGGVTVAVAVVPDLVVVRVERLFASSSAATRYLYVVPAVRF